MIEIDRYDWDVLDAQPSARGVPTALKELLRSTTVESANEAYWRIDNTVVVQGFLYEAALPTIRALIRGVHESTSVARPLVLELMVQLASGTNGGAERQQQLVDACRAELVYSVGYFCFLLEFGTEDEQLSCVDLLGLSVLADRALMPTIEWYFTYRGTRYPENVRALMNSTLTDLAEGAEPKPVPGDLIR